MLMEIVLVGCPCIPLAIFVVVPPELESINCGAYILKKINQAFAITIKRMVNLIKYFGPKTLKSVSLFYVATSFTLALPTTKCTIALISGHTLALSRWFVKM